MHRRLRTPATALALAIGLLLGIATGFIFISGDPVAFLIAVIVGCTLVLASSLVPLDHGSRVRAFTAIAYAFHLAALATLHVGLTAFGMGGFVTGDDREYARVSWGLAEVIRGNPSGLNWQADGYLLGTFVYLEAVIFYLVGPSVLAIKVLNAGFAVGAALFAYDWTRRVFGAGSGFVAAAIIAFFPSLLVWSSLNLKDALAVFLISAVLWALLRFQLRPERLRFALPFLVLLPLESVRDYIFVGLALVAPVAVVLSPQLRLISRLGWGTAAVAASGALIAYSLVGSYGSPSVSLLARLEQTRQGMTFGARTAFVETPVIRVEEGQTFVIATPSPSPLATTGPTVAPTPATSPTPVASPTIVHVSPNTRIVVIARDAPATPTATAGVVFVRPGDIVVVGGTSRSPAPSATPLVLARGGSVELAESREGDTAVARRTLRYLPRGITYALLAPFPWALERRLDALTVPDMVLWYLIAACAAATLVRWRSSFAYAAPVGLFIAGILLVLALAEGNVGTLYRHRSMVIPATAMLAAPTLLLFVQAARNAARGAWRRRSV